jgi:hypothetical protein
LNGFCGNWMDGAALQETGGDHLDRFRHLAKVRVAGSNPVIRSKKSRSGRVSGRPFSGGVINPRFASWAMCLQSTGLVTTPTDLSSPGR